MVVLKTLHISFALLSVTGFFIRGIWLISGSHLFHKRPTKILPHIIDTGLLASAIGLLYSYGWNPLDLHWIMAKLVALALYICLGVFAFRLANTAKQQTWAWLLSLSTALYILAVALTKSPLPFLM